MVSLSINGGIVKAINAWAFSGADKELTEGQQNVAESATSDLVVVAYSDVDGDGQFTPGVDIYIAGINDEDNSQTPTEGDAYLYGNYPLTATDSSDRNSYGTFRELEATVEHADWFYGALPDGNQLNTGYDDNTIVFTQGENYEQLVLINEEEPESLTRIIDIISFQQPHDIVKVTPSDGPGRPKDAALDTNLSQQDDSFINVDFYFDV